MNTRDEGDRTLRARSPQAVSPRSTAGDRGTPGTDPGTRGNLGLTKLSPTEWRVVDALRPDDDASRVLGFIQRVGDAYEVTSLVRLRERTYFSSFDRAAASLDPRPVLA
ncbi:hypothetical protein D6T64_04795 [Cryobacterium melibiosiphilum]|uniref:Uncharacterized protein n=1 Tax=Cryobacterium melibiosiphilum TaxID=995039 RepID=A0A3A5MSJ8_9MICO|nr:hypothetical protein [Cryobacterium melibiosiphilum]RJT90118.1 hypothetical protein D6T64_04795 [Cryobacterium melibiosiphilum]